MNWSVTFVELNKAHHNRASFDCGESELNTFIQTQAARHMQSGISRTMVLPSSSTSVKQKYDICAFYSIAPGSIDRQDLPEAFSKKLPHYPIPVFLIAQLGVHNSYHGNGLGKFTLQQALRHLWKINDHMRAYAVIVDCLTPAAESFYEKFGFKKITTYKARTRMFMAMKTVSKLFDSKPS